MVEEERLVLLLLSGAMGVSGVVEYAISSPGEVTCSCSLFVAIDACFFFLVEEGERLDLLLLLGVVVVGVSGVVEYAISSSFEVKDGSVLDMC